MKKFLIVLMAIIMAFTLFACNNNNDNGNGNGDNGSGEGTNTEQTGGDGNETELPFNPALPD